MLRGDSLFLVFSIPGCWERTLASYVAAGRLIPGFAAWLRSCVPGSLRHLLVKVWIGGHSADHSGQGLRRRKPRPASWELESEQERTLGEI